MHHDPSKIRHQLFEGLVEYDFLNVQKLVLLPIIPSVLYFSDNVSLRVIKIRYSLLILGIILLAIAERLVTAQQLNNDGFHRRNGQLRPMVRDARLPTGLVVTKDGFIVTTEGRRTELREGQGCDLNGNVVAVISAATGGLASLPPRTPARRTASTQAGASAAEQAHEALEDLFGDNRRTKHNKDDEYDKKAEERTREQHKKEEWQWEERKRREEDDREQGQRWKDGGSVRLRGIGADSSKGRTLDSLPGEQKMGLCGCERPTCD